MNFHCVTLFPESFDSYISESIIGRAISEKKIKINFYNPRAYAPRELKKKWPDGNITTYIDGRPFGGGPGMILRAEPILKTIEYVQKNILKRIEKENKKKITQGKKPTKPKIHIIFFSPGGELFTTAYAQTTVKKYTDVIFVCGRYEGIDARIKQVFKMHDVSIGDYVLTGGELPAMVCMDCIARQIPGVLGNFDSREESRTSSHDVYTRPEVLVWNNKKIKVPAVLLSGDPKKINLWKDSLK